PFSEPNQKYGTLEVNYRPSDELTLTSTTGYYRLTSNGMTNATQSTFAGPAIGAHGTFERRDLTQELRVNSELSGPLNFTLGGFYQDSYFENFVKVYGNRSYNLAETLQDGVVRVDIKTYSLFGQARWQLTPQVELAAGARWNDETRTVAS